MRRNAFRGAALVALLLGAAPALADEQVAAQKMSVVEVVNELATLTQRSMAVGAGVKGDVTLNTGKPVGVEDQARVYVEALSAIGVDLVDRDGVLVALPHVEAAKSFGVGKSTRLGSAVLPLRYAQASAMVESLRAALGTGAVVAAIGERALVVVDTVQGVDRARQLVREVDQPEDLGVSVISPRFQKAGVLVQALAGALGEKVTLRAVEPTNQVVVSGPQALRATMASLVRSSDRKQPPSSTRRIRLNGDPARVVASLKDALGLTDAVGAVDRIAAAPDGKGLLVVGSSDFQARLDDVLSAVDPVSPTVEVTGLVVEVSRTEARRLGLGLSAAIKATGEGLSLVNGSVLGQALGAAGVTGNASVKVGKLSIDGVLEFLQTNGTVRVVQRPFGSVGSGEEYRLEVGDEIPVPTSKKRSSTEDDSAVYEQIDRKTVGSILNVKPVVEGDRVKVDLSQEVSAVGVEYGDRGTSFSKRTIKSTVTLDDGEILVIGGISKSSSSVSKSGLPSGDGVPFLSFLFGGDSSQKEDLELIVLLKCDIRRSN